jgi:DNA-binding transcriptional ArsR family regulator
MPSRALVAKQLATLCSVLSNPQRVQIIEELRNGELDVNGLQAALGVTHSRASQHLAVLRSHRLVHERRAGRHVFYSLAQPGIARWLLDGLEFVEGEIGHAEEIRSAVEQVRAIWSFEDEDEGERSLSSPGARGTNHEDTNKDSATPKR